MNNTAVTDTSPLLHLFEINCLPFFSIFSNIMISPLVKNELIHYGIYEDITNEQSMNLNILDVKPSEIEAQQNELSGFRVQPTDVSIAVLARKFKPDVVLTDDLELRKGLENQGFIVTGSVGILIRAFKKKKFSKTELHYYLDQLFNGSTLYLSREFYEYAKKLINKITE